MGKLGGHELNFSSDIDLMFAFEHAGTCDGPRALDNEEFFLRLARRLVGALDEVDANGRVFRVDVRLRPFGTSGPLAVSFDAHGGLLPEPRPRLGTLRADQGAPGGRRPGGRRAAAQGTAAVRVSPLSGLRRHRCAARHEGADRRSGSARRAGRSRQAGRRRHPRDRVHRPGAPADPRRARTGPALPRHPRRCCVCSASGISCRQPAVD